MNWTAQSQRRHGPTSAAGSGVRAAPRRALHRSFADLRVRHTVATAHPLATSVRAQRLWDRDPPAGGVGRGRRQRAVELEPLVVAYDAGDAFGRPPVPPLDDRSRRRATRQGPLRGREDRVALGQDEAVRAVSAGDGTLGAGSHGETRHAQERRLLLEPARIGHPQGPPRTGPPQGPPRHQAEHLEIAQRLEQPQAAVVPEREALRLDALAGTRGDGGKDGERLCPAPAPVYHAPP